MSKLTIALIVVGFIALAVGWFIFAGWLAFLVYREFHPDSWPYIGLWWWVLIVFVVSAVMGGGSRR